MLNVAILDDYQGASKRFGDWNRLAKDVKVTAFEDHLTDEDAIAARLKDFEIVCMMRERTPFTASLLAKLPRLKLLVTSGMANRSMDVKAATARGVVCCGTKSAGSPTAELTWGLILGFLRHIPLEDRATRLGTWERTVGTSVEGKTLGCAGLGKLGSRVAKIGKAFGMNVIAWSQNLTAERCAEVGVELVSKADLLRRSDVITIHLILSDRSRGLFKAADLALMKPTAILVNTSRGPIVEEKALVDALERKAIAGAALDVFDTEPLPLDHPLRRLENTVITPHLGYVEENNYRAYFGGYVDAIRGFLDGKPVNLMKG